ncbi:MAG: SDR family oxidoreductase [Alphaproteobacteria bacterium]|nr:SDR family oxidoreductase [Alphaproteobacteria bacterium]
MKRVKSGTKVAVVTGGGTGIGRECARWLERDGFRVAVLGRRPDRLQPKRGERFCPYACNIADDVAAKRTIAAVVRDLGRIDVLVNNAGVFKEIPIEQTTRQDIDMIIGTNLVGMINITVAATPALKAARGVIINISSALSLRPYTGTSLYSATKGGMEAYTRSLAVELAPHRVRANAILPGLVRTEIFTAQGWTAAQLEAELNKWGKIYPLGRVGESSDIASIVRYMASDAANWLTGVMWPVEGGKLVA